MKKIIVLVLLMLLYSCQAFELDTSVDEEIRRNYNPSALEQKLPALPKTTPKSSQTTNVPKNLPLSEPSKVQIGVKKLPDNYDKSTAIKIKKGTKFKVKSNNVISDYLKEGARVSFTSTESVMQRYITVPAGTKFYATINDSHLPQYSGNGGLIVMAVDSAVIKGASRPLNAKITKANFKKIFFNNIKGKRTYWKGVGKQITKGENFYKKSRRASNKLADNPVGIIISPIPTIAGMAVYAVNFVGSPLFAIWSKGNRISIPAGAEFEIKLLEDVYLY